MHKFRPFLSFMGLLLVSGISTSLSYFSGLAIGPVVSVALFSGLNWAWFSVLHSCGHNAYFRSPILNSFAGHVASLFTLVPFYPWKYNHSLHHTWVGWRDIDPTTADMPETPPPRETLKWLEWAWRLWIPIISISHGVMHFWSYSGIKKNAANTRQKHALLKGLCSVVFIILAHTTIIFFLRGPYYWCWLLGYGFFLITSDPILLSQHALLKIPSTREIGRQKEGLEPYANDAHDEFTRTIRFHPFIDRFILLNFNLHNVHHRYPHLPHFNLHTIPHDCENDISGWDWIRAIKQKKVYDILFDFNPPLGTGQVR